jgi:RNA polymerase sigma-70 factor, ECF subfamily
MQPRILIAHPLRIVANLEATEPRCVCRNSRCAHQPLPNFFLPIAYSLHPRARIPADMRVEAKPMAHDWQPDFEQLVDQHQSMVFSLALRMTGDRGLAEEIAQDVFVELDRNLGRMENAAHACFWLRRVAMSRSADALRRRRVRGIDLWVEMEDVHGVPQEDRASPLGARLERLLATLPEPQHAALVLRYQEDLTPEEIAATLEAPLATVKSHLQRGLKLLRAKATTHLKEFVRDRKYVEGL